MGSEALAGSRSGACYSLFARVFLRGIFPDISQVYQAENSAWTVARHSSLIHVLRIREMVVDDYTAACQMLWYCKYERNINPNPNRTVTQSDAINHCPCVLPCTRYVQAISSGKLRYTPVFRYCCIILRSTSYQGTAVVQQYLYQV